MQTDVRPDLSGFEQIPLCATYVAVLLEDCPARVLGHCAVADCNLRWCLGVTRDGQTEVLGVWPESPPCGWSRTLVIENLLARGVQRVGLLVSGAPEFGDAFRRAFPGASVAASFREVAELGHSAASPGNLEAVSAGIVRVLGAESEHQAHAILDALAASSWQNSPASVQICRAAITSWRSLYILPKRARRWVRECDVIALFLRQGVSQAVVRHGPFESADDATAFAERWLVDAERRQRVRRRAQRPACSRPNLLAALG